MNKQTEAESVTKEGMAERVGFEPTVSFPTPVFKTGALNQALPPLR